MMGKDSIADPYTRIIYESSHSMPKESIASCRDEIVACGAGHPFGIVANRILLAIPTGTLVCLIAIQKVPALVLATHWCGFELVHSVRLVHAVPHYFLNLVSVSEDLLKNCKMPFSRQN
jgi:hypothetical protein